MNLGVIVYSYWKEFEMDFTLGGPPVLRMGQGAGYYEKIFTKIRETLVAGRPALIGTFDFAGDERVVRLFLKDDIVVRLGIPLFDGDSVEGVPIGFSPEKFTVSMKRKGYSSSVFSDEIIFYDDFVWMGLWGGKLDSIAWWDRNYWDQVSFIEDVYPK